MSGSIFADVPAAPRDPILGLIEAFNHDTRPEKVNLGVGVYFTEGGRIPVLRAVAEAERRRAAEPTARGYLPIEGIPAYDAAAQTYCAACCRTLGWRSANPAGRTTAPYSRRPGSRL